MLRFYLINTFLSVGDKFLKSPNFLRTRIDARLCKYKWYLQACSPCNVHGLELVKSSEHTSTGNTSKNVGTSTLHHGHETFILHNLHSAIHGALVLDTTAAGGHHHAPPDGVNGVGHESSSDCYSPSEEEGKANICVVSEKHGLQGVEHAEVHASVDEDTNSRDGEASVQALDTIRLEGLDMDINKTIELALTSLTLGIVGDSKDCLDGILEGEVKSLGGEVSEHIGQVS